MGFAYTAADMVFGGEAQPLVSMILSCVVNVPTVAEMLKVSAVLEFAPCDQKYCAAVLFVQNESVSPRQTGPFDKMSGAFGLACTMIEMVSGVIGQVPGKKPEIV